MANYAKSDLLTADALSGLRIAISASESPDLGRLGLVETHFRLALAEIARSILVGGGKLAYGGHLEPNGYTALLIQELQRYSRRDKPLQVCLAWQEHRNLALTELQQQQEDLGLFGEIIYLGPDGKPIAPNSHRRPEPEPVNDEKVRRDSLTSLRQFMTGQTKARVLIGGKRAGFEGNMPGVLEEAILALQAGQPLFLAGGFGGVTYDIIAALGIDDGQWLSVKADAPTSDPRLAAGLTKLTDLAEHYGPKALSNGLSSEEQRRLAATPRPSEIAALVSLGLGRQFATK
jgi:hypothetical protein